MPCAAASRTSGARSTPLPARPVGGKSYKAADNRPMGQGCLSRSVLETTASGSTQDKMGRSAPTDERPSGCSVAASLDNLGIRYREVARLLVSPSLTLEVTSSVVEEDPIWPVQ